jgi:hypothetical protein
MSTDNDTRAALERRANLERSRLAQTLESLDVRRHQLTDVRYQLRTHARQLLFAAGGDHSAVVARSGHAAILVGNRVPGVAAAAATTGDRASREGPQEQVVAQSHRHPPRRVGWCRPCDARGAAIATAITGARRAGAETGVRGLGFGVWGLGVGGRGGCGVGGGRWVCGGAQGSGQLARGAQGSGQQDVA